MWCRSSLSGRADALYVVNDALGSFLLRASEVIDQVPMSACGRFCCKSQLRQAANRDSVVVTRFSARSIHDGPSEE
jgi:hypothetical protein